MSQISSTSEALTLTAPRHLTWISENLPPLNPLEVLVETCASAISIGSELPLYRDTIRTGMSASYPHYMGYESVGRVMACGSAVRRVKIGERVVAFYGQRTLAIVPENKLIVVPKSVSDSLAILSILTCDAAKGVRKLAPLPEEVALITGAGTMGLLTLFILRAYGVANIDVIEPDPARHALAHKLGARRVLLPAELLPESEKYALAFECCSRNAAFGLLQQYVQKQGRICITADGNLEPLTLSPAFHTKELLIVGSSDGWDYHAHATWYFQQVQQRKTHLPLLFEKEILHTELIQTFEELDRGEIHPVKVLVHY